MLSSSSRVIRLGFIHCATAFPSACGARLWSSREKEEIFHLTPDWRAHLNELAGWHRLSHGLLVTGDVNHIQNRKLVQYRQGQPRTSARWADTQIASRPSCPLRVCGWQCSQQAKYFPLGALTGVVAYAQRPMLSRDDQQASVTTQKVRTLNQGSALSEGRYCPPVFPALSLGLYAR